RSDPAAAQLEQQVVTEAGAVLHEPMQVTHHRVRGWLKLWGRDADQRDEVVNVLKELRQAAVQRAEDQHYISRTSSVWCESGALCRACGYYVTVGEGHKSIPRMLVVACTSVLPAHRRRILQRLGKGQAPYCWMEEFEHRRQLNEASGCSGKGRVGGMGR
ncbi:MAG: hypothetical protein ACKPKO_49025, partial [Candidatus Fonsibacter sp.]